MQYLVQTVTKINVVIVQTITKTCRIQPLQLHVLLLLQLLLHILVRVIATRTSFTVLALTTTSKNLRYPTRFPTSSLLRSKNLRSPTSFPTSSLSTSTSKTMMTRSKRLRSPTHATTLAMSTLYLTLKMNLVTHPTHSRRPLPELNGVQNGHRRSRCAGGSQTTGIQVGGRKKKKEIPYKRACEGHRVRGGYTIL